VELYNFAKEIVVCDTEDKVEELLSPSGLSDYQAMIIFTRLVNLFVFPIELQDGTARYKKAVYLMIDELDDLLRASVKEAREVNDILRHLYDSCPNCFGLIVALSAEVTILPSIFEDYIIHRIQRQISLGQLNKDDGVEFVKQILDASRADSNGAKGFFPFDAEAVQAILGKLVNVTPRDVVDTMQQVLEEVRLAGLDPRSREADLSFLDDHDILEEILGGKGI
jgi:hypothetical protein